MFAGWSSPVARQAHNLKAAGSNPAPATNFKTLGQPRVFCFSRSLIPPAPVNTSAGRSRPRSAIPFPSINPGPATATLPRPVSRKHAVGARPPEPVGKPPTGRSRRREEADFHDVGVSCLRLVTSAATFHPSTPGRRNARHETGRANFRTVFSDSPKSERWAAFGLVGARAVGGRFCGLKAALRSRPHCLVTAQTMPSRIVGKCSRLRLRTARL